MKLDPSFKKNFWIVVVAVIAIVVFFKYRTSFLSWGSGTAASRRAPAPVVLGREEENPVQAQTEVGDPRGARKCGLVMVVLAALDGLCVASHPSPLDPMLARGIHDAGTTVDAGVRRLRISIDRDVLDRLAELPRPELCHGVGFVPEEENGRRIGVRLFGVRDGTLLTFLGLRKDDRIEKLEGFDITEHALDALAHLCTEERLTLRLNRAGEPLDIVYVVQ